MGHAENTPSDAILTIPNLLTFLRLALLPVFLWVSLGPKRLDIAFGLAVFGLVTDLADGRIARRFGQVSKLGVLLDPLSDRLALAAGAVVLIAHHLAPVWAAGLVIGRDVVLLGSAAALRARGVGIPPVAWIGKIGSFGVSLTFGLFLASGVASIVHPSRPLQIAAWVVFAVAAPAYYLAGASYVRVGLASMRRAHG